MTARLPFWLALVIAVATLFLASWIIVPAPTYFLLTFGVGAREVSAWLIVTSLVGIALAWTGIRQSGIAQIAVGCGVVSLALAVSPFVRLPGTIARFDAAVTGISVEPKIALRTSKLSIVDLFRGIPRGRAKATLKIPYAAPGGQQLTADVYQPERPGTYPVIVQIYGGAWQRGDPSSNAKFAAWIAAAGYVVFCVDYRHAPATRWPALGDDIDSSLAWVADNAARFGGDSTRIVLIGRSAGAHLAMMAAYRHPPVNIRGVISYYGPADLVESYKNPPHPDPLRVRDNEIALLGGTLEEMPARYAEASPVTLATRPLPPTLLVYGAADHIVEAKYGAALYEKLKASGTPVGYLEIPWAEHAFDEVFQGPSSQLALYYTERFLAWATR